MLLVHDIELRLFFTLLVDVLIRYNLLVLIVVPHLLLDLIADDVILVDLWSFGGSPTGRLKYFRGKRVFLFLVTIPRLFGF